ncbi:hypothetical protein [Microcoleus sp. A2-C2]
MNTQKPGFSTKILAKILNLGEKTQFLEPGIAPMLGTFPNS